jgi:hypothetical protein
MWLILLSVTKDGHGDLPMKCGWKQDMPMKQGRKHDVCIWYQSISFYV